jgi:hypothetical protein
LKPDSSIRIQEAILQEMVLIHYVPARADLMTATQTINPYPDQIGRVIKATGPITEGNEHFVLVPSADQRTHQNNSFACIFV